MGMEAVLLSVLAALAAQFVCLPFLIGARTGAEIIGWNLIIGIFTALPALVFYFFLFGVLHAVPAPAWATVAIATATPALLILTLTRKPVNRITRNNYILWMGVIGGLAGGLFSRAFLRPRLDRPDLVTSLPKSGAVK